MYALTRLDVLRARCLKLSFRLPWAEEVYRTRSLRLLAQYALAFAFAAVLALHWPLLPLLVAPLLAGPVHLLLSADVIRERLWAPLALGGALIAFYSPAPMPVAIALAFGVIAIRPQTWSRACALMFVGGLLAWVAWINIFLAAALAGFGHNFVSFVFWFRACRYPKERATCLIAGLSLFAMTAAILLGAFELSEISGFDDLARGLSYLGEPKRVLSAFALGQSVHYFVWLKAIPDQRLQSPIPPGFRVRFLAFEKRVGRLNLAGVCVATAILIGFAFVHLDEARRAYAAAAALHGWLELAALGL